MPASVWLGFECDGKVPFFGVCMCIVHGLQLLVIQLVQMVLHVGNVFKKLVFKWVNIQIIWLEIIS